MKKPIIFTFVFLLIVIGFVYAKTQNQETFNKICNQPIPDTVGYLYFNESPTQSMYPTINKTSIAFIEKVTNETKLEIGDIISFKVPEKYGCFYVHRIIKIKYDDSGIYYTTKGDNNWLQDFQKTRIENIDFKIIKIK